MNYKNKLGVFTFDDDLQESHMKLIVQNVTGQYLNPKKGEPYLTDEESCYAFIRERCGNVLAGVGFELEINEDMRNIDVRALMEQEIQDIAEAAERARLQKIRDFEDRLISAIRKPAIGGWLIGPAAVG